MPTILGYLNYTTEQGDRWDTVASKAYGDVEQIPALLAANRSVGAPVAFEAGTVLRVPILSETDLTSPDLLPPWKR